MNTAAKGVRMKPCFVIMPMGGERAAHFRNVFDTIIRPSAKKAGFDAERSDDIVGGGVITARFIRRIIMDPLVIADLTELRANVFYELGVRHALQKPTILLAELGTEIPFDIHPMHVIFYTCSEDAWKSLDLTRNTIVENIKSIFEKLTVVENVTTHVFRELHVEISVPGHDRNAGGATETMPPRPLGRPNL